MEWDNGRHRLNLLHSLTIAEQIEVCGCRLVVMKVPKKLHMRLDSIQYCLRLLDKSIRFRLVQLICVQILLSIADLVGVALVGIVGTIALGGILGQPPNSFLQSFLDFIGLEGETFTTQVIILSLSALVILTSRSILSMQLSLKVLKYLSNVAASLTITLFSKLTRIHPSQSSRLNRQDTILAITNGPNTIVLGVISTGVSIIADVFLGLGMLTLLVIVEPLTAAITFLIFVTVAVSLHKISSKGIARNSKVETKLSMQINRNIEDTLRIINELHLTDSKQFKKEDLAQSRITVSNATAVLQFLPSISKYLMETLIVLGGFVVAGFQLLISDLSSAASTFAIFLVSASRIAPSIMRIQQNVGILNSNLGRITPYREIIDFLRENFKADSFIEPSQAELVVGEVSLEVRNLSFQYPISNSRVIHGLNFSIEGEGLVGIVGKSGSGKSTLLNLLLGLEIPSEGSVRINGLDPSLIHSIVPGYMAYVPQEVKLIDGTVKENIALGSKSSLIDEDLICNVIEDVGLSEVLLHRNLGLDSELLSLSGGQKQRLGLARALYLKPRILVLDEPTASLDESGDSEIVRILVGLKSSMLIILVTHKTENLAYADRVVYLQDGRIKRDVISRDADSKLKANRKGVK